MPPGPRKCRPTGVSPKAAGGLSIAETVIRSFVGPGHESAERHWIESTVADSSDSLSNLMVGVGGVEEAMTLSTRRRHPSGHRGSVSPGRGGCPSARRRCLDARSATQVGHRNFGTTL